MLRNKMRQYIPKSLLLLVLQIMICGIVYGQQPVGNLSGVVTDQAGSVLPNATITLTSLTTGLSRTLTSNGQGYFLAASLQAGPYKVKVTAEGFSTYEVDRLVVEVGQTPNLGVKMQVGGANESVQISGSDTSLVDTVSTSVGGVVSVRQIEQLPLNGRNYLELAKLQPGVETQEGRAFDVTKSRYAGISIGSRQGREARITIDGIDAVDEHVGTTTLNISQDSIQEFQVSTSSSDPSTGLSATGGVNIVTKRGGNEIHGSAFGFARNNRISARPSLSTNSPYFRREQFGGSLGGALIKDKLFGFSNYERTQEKSVLGVSVPKYFPNLTAYKAPFTLNSFTGRGDYHLSEKNDLLFRMSLDDNSNFGGFGGNILPSSGFFNKNRTYQYVAGIDTVVNPKITNSFRAGLTSFKNRITRPDADAKSVAIPGLENVRIVTSDTLLISGPDVNTPQSTGEVFGQFRDDVTYFTNSHTLRAGADVVRYRTRVFNFAANVPTITVNALAGTTLADIQNLTVKDFQIGNRKGIRIPGADDNSHRNTRSSVYAEDSWRIKPNLTLSYGARYSIDSHPLNNDLNKPQIISTILPNGTASTPVDRNNVSPHVGFAYDPWKDGKTSFRAGAGIYYAQQISNLVTQERTNLVGYNLGQNAITVTSGDANKVVDFDGDPTTPNQDFSGVFTTNLTGALPIILNGQAQFVASPGNTKSTFDVLQQGVVVSNDLETPYSQQFNVGVQRELPLNSVIDINLIYSRTVHEFQRDVDAANTLSGNGTRIAPGAGTIPLKRITLVKSDGFSRYKALNMRYDKRFGMRFQTTASYSFSKLETTAADGLGLGNLQNFFNRNNEGNLGVGPFDRRHRFVFNGIVELPRGFRFSGLSTVYSGVPANATISADLNNDGITTDLLPGTRRGALNRSITSVDDFNSRIRAYNLSLGPFSATQTKPYLFEIPSTYRFGDSVISQDIQLSYTRKLTEGFKLEATAQIFNAFNVSNLVGTQGLLSSGVNGAVSTITSANMVSRSIVVDPATGSLMQGTVRQTAGSDNLQRPTVVTGTGQPRSAQFGLRLVF